MASNYKNYFNKHYKYTFTKSEIEKYKEWFYPQWNLIVEKTEIKDGKRALEIGSAIGGFYSLLSENTKLKGYSGIELDESACEFAQKSFGKKLFKNTTLEKFKSKENFDYVFAFEVLEHLSDPESQIDRIYSLLKVKGVFIGTSPYPFAKNIAADETHTYVLHPDNWVRIFNNAGFKQVKTYPMSFVPFIWRVNKRLNIRFPFYLPFKYMISTSLIIASK